MKPLYIVSFVLAGTFVAAANAEWRYYENTDLMDDSKFTLAIPPRVESMNSNKVKYTLT